MNCLEAQRLMRLYTEGTLPDRVTEEFLDHIETCRDCHEELELYLLVHQALDDKPMPAGSKHPGIDEQIRMTRNAISRRRIRRYTLGFLGMVSAVLIVLFVHMGLDSHSGIFGKRDSRKAKEALTESITEVSKEAISEMITETVEEST